MKNLPTEYLFLLRLKKSGALKKGSGVKTSSPTWSFHIGPKETFPYFEFKIIRKGRQVTYITY